jgi:hypothetical protein
VTVVEGAADHARRSNAVVDARRAADRVLIESEFEGGLVPVLVLVLAGNEPAEAVQRRGAVLAGSALRDAGRILLVLAANLLQPLFDLPLGAAGDIRPGRGGRALAALY